MSYKGGCRFLKLRTPQLKPLKIENDIIFSKTYMIYHNNYYQPIWKCDFFNFQPTLMHIYMRFGAIANSARGGLGAPAPLGDRVNWGLAISTSLYIVVAGRIPMAIIWLLKLDFVYTKSKAILTRYHAREGVKNTHKGDGSPKAAKPWPPPPLKSLTEFITLKIGNSKKLT